MIWWSNICLSPTQCQCQHCFLEPALPFWYLCRTNPHSDRSENQKLQLPANSQSQQMALRCTAGSWMWRQAMEIDYKMMKREKKWKIQRAGRDRWRRPSLSKREKLKGLSNQMSGLSQEVLLSRKKPVVTRRQKKHHCIKRLKRKHCHEPFQFIFPHWTLTSVVSDIPSICKCSSVGRGAMRRQKLWIIDAMHSLLTVTSALRIKIRPIHGSS